MIIDLHTHSTASDGGLTPQELVARAVDRGVDLLAITDHDTVDAYQAVEDLPGDLQLVCGAAVSCNYLGFCGPFVCRLRRIGRRALSG